MNTSQAAGIHRGTPAPFTSSPVVSVSIPRTQPSMNGKPYTIPSSGWESRPCIHSAAATPLAPSRSAVIWISSVVSPARKPHIPSTSRLPATMPVLRARRASRCAAATKPSAMRGTASVPTNDIAVTRPVRSAASAACSATVSGRPPRTWPSRVAGCCRRPRGRGRWRRAWRGRGRYEPGSGVLSSGGTRAVGGGAPELGRGSASRSFTCAVVTSSGADPGVLMAQLRCCDAAVDRVRPRGTPRRAGRRHNSSGAES